MTGNTDDIFSNVNLDEIEKFSQLADKWWDQTGEFKPLHQINPLRLGYINLQVGLQGKTILDVGCGGGILTESMAKLGAKKVLGIDMAEKSLKIAEAHAQKNNIKNIEYQCIAVEALAMETPGSYDVVTCMEMLEHVPDPMGIVAACTKLVKPNGKVFFSTINRNRKSYIHAIIGAEYLLSLVPKGTHDWQKFIKPAELARMCRIAGLNEYQTMGLGYDLLTKQYKLHADNSVNYMVACDRLR